jgi:DNA-binding beta-propeller fold protein YncE
MRVSGFTALLMICFFALSCKTDEHVWNQGEGNFPTDVAKIIQTQCATPGCHDNKSRSGAAGLSLETWDEMFKGTKNGAVVIPYNHKQSTLFLYCNTYDKLGVSNKPTMPYLAPPLSEEKIILIRDWIDKGAPDAKGNIKFADNPKRKKYYVVNQGCDLVTVFDAESYLPMRYIQVGNNPGKIESPHQIRVSPDGEYWYVLFLSGDYFQKYKASDDSFVAEIKIGSGSWNTFQISSDGKSAWTVDYSSSDINTPGQGIVAYIDLGTMTLKRKYAGNGLFSYPHGVVLNNTNKILYVFGQEGSQFYKINMDPDSGNSAMAPDISPAKTMNGSFGALLKPHDALFHPDGSKYYVSCQNTDEIRVFNTADDQLLAVIPTGNFPQELAISTKRNLLFVSCMEDETSFINSKGSVYVIDMVSNSVVKKLNSGYQPHGLAVDDQSDLLIIANRNASITGPAPHHTTECGGRNGYVSYANLNTLEMISSKKVEVSVDPYFVSIR